MRNLRLALATAGAGFANEVKTTTYVVGCSPDARESIIDARALINEGGPPPDSALVGVSALARREWLIEIEATAVPN